MLCQRYHFATEGSGHDSGGRHAVPPIESSVEGQDSKVRMAGEHPRATQEILFPDDGRGGGLATIEPELERTEQHGDKTKRPLTLGGV